MNFSLAAIIVRIRSVMLSINSLSYPDVTTSSWAVESSPDDPRDQIGWHRAINIYLLVHIASLVSSRFLRSNFGKAKCELEREECLN
jgi:hypothetical protein